MSLEKDLKRLKNFDTLIASKRREKNKLGAGIAQNLAGEFESGQTEKLNEHIRRQCDAIDQEIMAMYDQRAELVAAIDSLDNPSEALVLRLFYVNNEPWSAIRYQLGKRRSTCQAIKKQAIEHLGQKIKKTN